MPFFPSFERVFPDRLHDYEVRLIDGTTHALAMPKGCWPRRGSLKFMATVHDL